MSYTHNESVYFWFCMLRILNLRLSFPFIFIYFSVLCVVANDDAIHEIPARYKDMTSTFLREAPILCERMLNRDSYTNHDVFTNLLQDVGRFLKDEHSENFQFKKIYLLNPIINFDDKTSYYFINVCLQSHMRSISEKLNVCHTCQKSQYLYMKNLMEFKTENLHIPVVMDIFKFTIIYEFLDVMYRSVKTKFILNYNDTSEDAPIKKLEPGLYPYIKNGCENVLGSRCDENQKVNILSLPNDDNFFYTIEYAKAILSGQGVDAVKNTDSIIAKIEEMKLRKEELRNMEDGRIDEDRYGLVFF